MLADMQFKGVWRDYQARVLAEMEGHLEDGRLHIVAAPGSGKTVLGLETMRRIGRPALILVPSIAIRNQWRERLFPLFLDDPHGWDSHISLDFDAPSTMTIATYQALHAVHEAGAARFDAVAAMLAARGPMTLIIDEAHHLRREWWTALFTLRDRLKDAQLIALTATPPYDAPFAEWSRYEALCGPIDIEISVPELVRNGDLCPHQDHVHISRPRHDEYTLLVARRRAIETLAAGLLADASLIDCLAAHPWLTEPLAHEEELLEQPEYLTALMIALNAAGRPIPRAATDLLGVGAAELPKLDPLWLERLLGGLLSEPRSRLVLGDERWGELRRALNGLGLIENQRVTLSESRSVFTTMAGSLAKLDSIVAIARAETETLGEHLRLVILSDRVRADELPRHPGIPFAPTKIGVVPIFEALRLAGIAPDALAVLTGTLVILPDAAGEALNAEASAMRIPIGRLCRRAIGGCPGYFSLEAEGDSAQVLVALVTRLFQRGAIRLLVGTQALLGEGWDAPAINSLILASNAGSYMLSNQMRGRAIRIDPAVPGKVAAIWHLATVTAGNDGDALAAESGDVASLARRFDAFEGIANGNGLAIGNGVGRLAVDFRADPEVQNEATLALARDRAAVAAKWRASLGDATPRSRVRLVAEASHAPRSLAWRDTLQALIVSGVSGGALAGANALRPATGLGFSALLMLFFGATFLYSLPKVARAALLWWRNGTLERSLVQVGEVLVASLQHAGVLTQDPGIYSVLVRRTMTGRCEMIIDGATRAEERAFLEALAELLGPVQNPRYLLVRQSLLWRRWRADYHAIPAAFAARKEVAEHFHAQWRRSIGTARLVYTRNGEGRRILLRARVQSFAAGMQGFCQRRSIWM